MSFKVLVVNHDVLAPTWGALRAAGHVVVTADTPNAALDAVVAHRPDAVVLDLTATHVNQFALAHALRSTLPAGTPILVFDKEVGGANADEHDAADLVLRPPFEPTALGPLLQSLHRLRQGHRTT